MSTVSSERRPWPRERATRVVQLRLTDRQYDWLIEDAADLGLTLSERLREIVEDAQARSVARREGIDLSTAPEPPGEPLDRSGWHTAYDEGAPAPDDAD